MRESPFQTLIHELLDGTISPEGHQRLEEILKRNKAARQLYYRQVSLHQSLQYRLSPGSKVTSVKRMAEGRRKRQGRRNLRFSLAAAAALIVVAAVTLKLVLVPLPAPTLSFRDSPGSHYELVHVGEPERQPEGMEMEIGSTLSLSQGAIELQFDSGVKSLIQAPASLVLLEKDRLFLREGTGWFSVPPEAVNFTVLTPELEIIDLGTEFGVISMHNALDEVHVLKGKVEAIARRGHKGKELLTTGMARVVQPNGRFKEREVDRSAFLQKLPASMFHLHWSFDEEIDGAIEVEGLLSTDEKAQARLQPVDGAVSLSDGRFGKALSIANSGRGFVSDWPGLVGKSPRSVSMWVKLSDEVTYPRSPRYGDGNGGIAVAGFVPADPKPIEVVGTDSNFDGDFDSAMNVMADFEVRAGDQRKLVVTLNFESKESVRSLTYGEQPFTLAEANTLGIGRNAQIWYLDDPEVGSADITATFTGNCRSRAGVLSLQHAAPGGPVVSSSIANGAGSIGLTTDRANTLVVGSYIQNPGKPPVVDPFSSTLYRGNSGSSMAVVGYQNEAAPGLKNYSYTKSDGPAIVAWGDWSAPDTVFKVNVGQHDDGTCHLFAEWNGYAFEGSIPLSRGKWHHLVVSTTGLLDAEGWPVADFYVDGVRDSVVNWEQRRHDGRGDFDTFSGFPEARPMVVGMGLAGPLAKRQIFRGELDELYVICGAIDAESVRELYLENKISSQ